MKTLPIGPCFSYCVSSEDIKTRHGYILVHSFGDTGSLHLWPVISIKIIERRETLFFIDATQAGLPPKQIKFLRATHYQSLILIFSAKGRQDQGICEERYITYYSCKI